MPEPLVERAPASDLRVIRGFLDRDEVAAISAFADRLAYYPGRQGTGYEKSPVGQLFKWVQDRCLAAMGLGPDVPCDRYVVRYPAGAFIPPHKDDAPLAREHWRVNALVEEGEGGGLVVEGLEVELSVGDAYVFRPDLLLHEVRPVTAGRRVIWTVGALR